MAASIMSGFVPQSTLRWRPIGKQALEDLVDFTFKSTPYSTAEDMVMAPALRGGVGFIMEGDSEMQEFPADVELDVKGDAMEYYRSYVICGMLPTMEVGDRPPLNNVVVNFKTGYFVGKFDKNKRPKIGWRFKEQDSQTFVSEPTPDPRVKVFVWPGHEPDITAGMPFRSRLAVLLQPQSMMEEMRSNLLDAEWLAAHPPLITSTSRDGGGNKFNGTSGVLDQIDMQRDAMQARVSMRSLNAQYNIRKAEDQVMVETEYNAKVSEAFDSNLRTIGSYAGNGERQIIHRTSLFNNRIPLMQGATLEKPVLPPTNTEWVDRERFVHEMIFRALGAPFHSGSSARKNKGTGSGESQMTLSDLTTLRQTVMSTRDIISDAFTFVYRTYMGESKSKMVRARKEEVLKQMDHRIDSARSYLSYLWETDQMETEPMYRANLERVRAEDRVAREQDLAERTAMIVEEAHRKGAYLDSAVVYQHLAELKDMNEEYKEAPDKANDEKPRVTDEAEEKRVINLNDLQRMLEIRRKTEQEMDEQAKKLRTVRLVFKRPPNVDVDHVINMAKDGLYNPEEAVKLVNETMGIDRKTTEAMLKDVDFVPLAEKMKMEFEREKMQLEIKKMEQQMKLEKQKMEQSIVLEREKMEVQKQAAKEKAKMSAAKPAGGAGSSSAKKKKAKSSDKPKKPAAKKKKK